MAIAISFSLSIVFLDTCLVATGSQDLCQSPPQEHQLHAGEGSADLSTTTCPVPRAVSTSPPVCLTEGMGFKPRH